MIRTTFPALKATNRLPSPPAVAMRILQLVASEDTTMDELAHVIGADPALTAKILKYLHSPLIGLGFHGTTVSEAVARIGTRGAQLLALSFSLISQKQHQCSPSFDFNKFWSKSLARAVASKRLAAMTRQWDPEEAFISGLVFRIGQLVLATALAADYEPVLSAASGSGDTLQAQERSALGTDHYLIGYHLLQDWKLPDTVIGAIKPFTIFPPSSAESLPPQKSTPLLRLADQTATFMVQSKADQARSIDPLMTQASELAGLDRERFRPVLEQIAQDWINYGALLSIATGEAPDLDALEQEADEYRTALRLAAEVEVVSLRNENQQLSHLASRDRLTGLLNRGAFDDMLNSRVAAAESKGSSLALFMMDLDHFKSVNDRYGHPAGDAVLRHVARILHTRIKTPTEAFRYGGEEFAVLISDADKNAEVELAEVLRQSIADTPHIEGSKTISLTISIGIARAQWPDQALTAAGLVQTADQYLYQAKKVGRNMTCHAPL